MSFFNSNNSINLSKIFNSSDHSNLQENLSKPDGITDFFMKDFPFLPFASSLEKKIFQSYETKNNSIYES